MEKLSGKFQERLEAEGEKRQEESKRVKVIEQLLEEKNRRSESGKELWSSIVKGKQEQVCGSKWRH